MKTMNFLVLFTMIFSLNSCSVEENQTIDNLTDVQQARFGNSESEESTEYFEIALHQFYLEQEKAKLAHQKRILIEQIEGGDEERISELEELQQEEERNARYRRYNGVIIDRYAIKFPGVRPPKPCIPKKPGEEACPVPGLNVFKILEVMDSKDIEAEGKTTEGEVFDSTNESERHTEYEELKVFTLNLEVETGNLTVSKYYPPANAYISYTLSFIRI